MDSKEEDKLDKLTKEIRELSKKFREFENRYTYQEHNLAAEQDLRRKFKELLIEVLS